MRNGFEKHVNVDFVKFHSRSILGIFAVIIIASTSYDIATKKYHASTLNRKGRCCLLPRYLAKLRAPRISVSVFFRDKIESLCHICSIEISISAKDTLFVLPERSSFVYRIPDRWKETCSSFPISNCCQISSEKFNRLFLCRYEIHSPHFVLGLYKRKESVENGKVEGLYQVSRRIALHQHLLDNLRSYLLLRGRRR